MKARKFLTTAIATATVAGAVGFAYAQTDPATGLNNNKPASAYQGSNGSGPLGAHNGDATLDHSASDRAGFSTPSHIGRDSMNTKANCG